jgi:small-conductance mechanosensitive channel
VSIFARGSLDAIPGLIFIGMLTLVVRYILKLLRLLSAAIENGSVTFSGFEPEWAWPLFKLVRIAAIALGVVVAFPYIPGSQTEAFKGVSIFIGVVLSLGSSAMISNSISGYMLTFRQAFKVGDRVKIGEQVGNVLQIRNNVTYLASLENEVVTVPNSSIMNSVVINYSAGARKKGLRLPIMVSIGYETPWRQVEAMLLLAAKRTSGLLRQPSPFVAIRGLGDFAVAYQLNAYTDQPQKKGIICTELHRNILDVFNEYEIQIMSPAYEGDPDQPKVVPKDKWYAPPALPADGEPPMQDEPK